MIRHAAPTAFFFALASASVLAGCGDILADRCDTICNCENCGERERQDCEVVVGADLEVADAYECTDVLEMYFECQLDEHECDGDRYRDDPQRCRDEREEYEECTRAQSTREPGPY